MENLTCYYNCIDEALTLYWRTLGKARGMKIYSNDIEYVTSDNGKGPERIFNIRIDSDNVEERINEIIAHIKAGIIPDSFLITPNTQPKNLVDILSKKGFKLDTTGSYMVMDLFQSNLKLKQPKNVKMKKVNNLEDLAQWIMIINNDLFGSEIVSYDQFHDIYLMDNTNFYIALYDNVPAAACMTITDKTIADLDMVATRKEYRKRGLATEIINKALIDLKEYGIKTVSLRAEPDGINLYKKIGFKECGERIVVSCDYENIYKKTTCSIEKESIIKAREIYDASPNIETFVEEMQKQGIIGREIWYDKSDKVIYITKMYASDCGGGCTSNKCLIGQRCHCDYVNSFNEYLSIDYCKCSAEFFRPMFGPIFGEDVEITPVETVLSGGTKCTFAINYRTKTCV